MGHASEKGALQAFVDHQKDLQMQAFSEAAEGIRTLDLLHGNQ
jgi:hypothetical protein